MLKNMQMQHSQDLANFKMASQQENANQKMAHQKEMREIEAQLAAHALANPHSHQAHAVVLKNGIELQDPYKHLEIDIDVDPNRKRTEMNGGKESPPMTPSARVSEAKKGKKTCEESLSGGVQMGKEVDGLVEDLPYEEEGGKDATKEVLLQPATKVTKKSKPPKVLFDSQLVTHIPYPSRVIKSRENFKYAKFCDMLEKLEVTLPFTEVVLNMPTYTKFLKNILTNKRVLDDQEIVEIEEACSDHILQKIPTKLGDPGSFSISCVVGGVPISRALCDLLASVSVIPLKVARKIGIHSLAPTTMTLPLADRSVKRPLGVLEDIPVKVRKYLIPADFVVLDISEDSHTPIILGRPFLATGGLLIDVRNGRLTFRIEGDKVEFNLPNLMKGPKVERACTIEVIDEVVKAVAREESEIEEAFQISLHDEEMKEDHEVDDEILKKVKGLLPPKVQLKPLPPSLKYAFLGEGESYPVIINANLSEAQEMKLLKVLKAYKSSLGYNIEDIKELSPNLCMHRIMLEEGSQPKVKGLRRINPKMAEVVKNEVLKLLEAGIIYQITDSKSVRSFLGHAGFYRRFIKDFSKIAKPLTSLLLKDVPFVFDEVCLESFHRLKQDLVSAYIIRAPDWNLPFEIICNASDFAVGAVLGQVVDKRHHLIYYTSKTLDQSQCNYSTIEKEVLAIVHAIEKFRQYVVGSKVVVYTDHTALRQHMVKKDAKTRLLRWVLLLQEFELEIKDKAGTENVLANHLSRLMVEDHGIQDESGPFNEWLREYSLMGVSTTTPWFGDLANYLVNGFIPDELDSR
ncbi:uncharacterized protein LOC141643851 [Silene latifolia]|uniref:uncharacterized protein LOC141643851 n=1 Tax=Silene latifolia TaxID=37657 RepID=UPI003D784DB0